MAYETEINTKKIAKALGKRLKKLRLERGLSMADLALFASVSLNAYRLWEHGKQLPRLEGLLAVAGALKVDAKRDLLEGML